MKKIFSLFTLFLIVIVLGCSQKTSTKFLKAPLSVNSRIGVIIDCPNDIKNIVLTKFLKKGYQVKAINASDLYTISDVFDVEDYQKLAYSNSDILGNQQLSDNVYKMHIYQFELNKAETLTEIRKNWGIDYMIILDLKDWKEISWARAVNLTNMELIWVENYPTKYTDELNEVLDHFVNSITGK